MKITRGHFCGGETRQKQDQKRLLHTIAQASIRVMDSIHNGRLFGQQGFYIQNTSKVVLQPPLFHYHVILAALQIKAVNIPVRYLKYCNFVVDLEQKTPLSRDGFSDRSIVDVPSNKDSKKDAVWQKNCLALKKW